MNLAIHDIATDVDGQMLLRHLHDRWLLGDSFVNTHDAPFMEVLPRKYRFRILNACMSRFIKLALSWNWTAVPFQFIANDGNFVVNPIDLLALDEQGTPSVTTSLSTFQVPDRRPRLSREPVAAA